MNQAFRTNEPDVIHQVFDEEVVAIYVPSGVYYSLSGVAGDIFLALGAGAATASQVASDLASKYDGPAETIHSDVLTFLDQLAQESLIVPVNLPIAPISEAPSANGRERIPYVAPALQIYSDLKQLLLLDPVHDVSAAGWPNLPPTETPVAEAETFRCRVAGPHVISERFEDETVAINTFSGAYYALYGPAEDVFLLMPDNPTLEEIQKALASKYVLDGVENLDTALRDYLRNLETAGLIVLELPPPDLSPARDLALKRPGTELPFSTLSLQLFEDPQVATSGAFVGEGLPAGKRRYRANEFLHAIADGELVAIDQDSGKYYRFNEAAADALALLTGQLNIEELARILVQKYAIAERDLIAAAMIFMWHLLRMNMVTAVPDEQPQPAPAPTLTIPAERLPFKGFDISLHQDLVDLIRSMNVAAPPAPKPPAGRSAQLCDMLQQYFEEAAARQGVTDSYFNLGGAKLQVRHAGSDNSELEGACAHLRTTGPIGSSDLTIHVFDGTTPASDYFLSLMLDKLYTNWGAVCGPRCEVLAFHSNEVPVIYHPGPDILSVVDIERGQAYFLKRDASPMPYWEIGSPFRYILHCWFASRGLQFVHGGAVGTPEGGVLLAGKGGSGKSTTSMLCVREGLLYAGDDYCLADPKMKFIFSMYDTGKLNGPEDLQRLPEMAGQSRNGDSFERGGNGKGVFFISDIWPARVTSGFSLRAILIPRVSAERDSRLEPCSRGEALVALLPSTVAQLPAANQADCDRMTQLVGDLPAYVFHLGTDLEQIPAVVRRLLG